MVFSVGLLTAWYGAQASQSLALSASRTATPSASSALARSWRPMLGSPGSCQARSSASSSRRISPPRAIGFSVGFFLSALACSTEFWCAVGKIHHPEAIAGLPCRQDSQGAAIHDAVEVEPFRAVPGAGVEKVEPRLEPALEAEAAVEAGAGADWRQAMAQFGEALAGDQLS